MLNPIKVVCRIQPLLIASFFAETCLFAKTTPQTEIHVTLLGQPCLLQGPFDEPTLKAIHSIGPAQIYPNISEANSPTSSAQTHKALEKIRAVSSLPSLLDRYREKLGKRLEAQSAFLDGLATSKKNQQFANLIKIAQHHLPVREMRKFQALITKLNSVAKGSVQAREMIEQLFDLYNESIEPDPESEFHRAIKKLNVEYLCSFDDGAEPSGE